MRLLILDENYPHLNNLMGDVFVHVRAKEYLKQHEVKVFSFFHKPDKLVYEGVPVEFFDEINSLVQATGILKPDKILVHFYQSWMLEKIIKVFKIPVIIWVHGYEALGWYRRLFNYTWYSPVFFKHIQRNIRQQYHFRKLIQYANNTSSVRFVFVSNWMRKITQQDTLSRIDQFDIIANPVDVDLFRYEKKDSEQRKKILLLRSFGSRKYANDISVKAIEELSKRKCFSDLSFTIIGNGALFDEVIKPVKHFSNINIQKGPVRQILIPAIHRAHGIFLCPTRQDAQGVSMCEAMASGLVPVTSDNTAIPEFVTHDKTGILTHSSSEIADALEALLQNSTQFSQISERAAQSVRTLCGIENIIHKELSLIMS